MEDPIQQLLKNTGWSYDELVKKIGHYKSEKQTTTEGSTSTSEPQITTKISPDECIVDSTADICKDIQKSKNVESEEIHSLYTNENVSNSNIVNEDLLDTDDEVIEVNLPSTDTVNEIIDDMYPTRNLEDLENRNDGFQIESYKEEESATITEVRIIEINSDEEDDEFVEEENFYKIPTLDITSNSSKTIQYLETYPRKSTLLVNKSVLNNDVNNINSGEASIQQREEHQISNEIHENSGDVTDYQINTNDANKMCKQDCVLENSIYSETLLVNSNEVDSDEHQTNRNTGYLIDQPHQETIDFDDQKSSALDKCYHERSVKLYEDCINKGSDNFIIDHSYKDTMDCVEEPANRKAASLKEGSDDDTENFREDHVDRDTVENLEDIRNNLKLQLTSLRTRKRQHFLPEVITKVVDNTDTDCEEKATRSKKLDTATTDVVYNENTNLNHKSFLNQPLVQCDNNTDLYTQTNEFGIVILNVQGGIEIDDIENLNKKNAAADNLNENISKTNNSDLENSEVFDEAGGSVWSQNNVELCQKNDEANEVLEKIRKIIHKPKETEKNTIHESIRRNKISSFNIFPSSPEPKLYGEGAQNKKEDDHNILSPDNSTSSYTNEEVNQTFCKNSPFVSNTLDEFLTGNSKLNISYNIPKSGAEEGLTDSYHEVSPLVLKKVVNLTNETIQKSKNSSNIKAKTVAQKRKLLEKQRLKELKKMKVVKSEKENIKTPVVDTKKNSFLIVNNKKIWVKSLTPNTCVGKIKVKHDRKEELKKEYQHQRKPSLLDEIARKSEEKLKYWPGPLCKKPDLQINGQNQWEVFSKILPKVSLELTPQIGHPVNPIILNRLPQCDGNITKNQIEYALSMVKTKKDSDTEVKSFIFPQTYHNKQENILVRKCRSSPVKLTNNCDISVETELRENIVTQVINDLITYVEIKELSNTIIKEEDFKEDVDDKFDAFPLPMSQHISSICRKPTKKRSGIELELSRLNCKVVNVEVEENENLPGKICDKDFCKLGCLCKSLKCENVISYHCQKVACMFDCTCPKEKSIKYDHKLTLPSGTDILSSDAVSRIEDEAKKNLAKVEREFTQTVIYTNDKTIVVGSGGRNNTKRVSKIPKKFSDYIDTSENDKETLKDKDMKTKMFLNKCVVSLEKLNIANIVPYCLNHNRYNCTCDDKTINNLNKLPKPRKTTGYSVNAKTEYKSKAFVEPKQLINNRKHKMCQLNNNDKEKQESQYLYVPGKTGQEELPDESCDKPYIVNCKEENLISAHGRPIRNIKKVKLKEDFDYSNEVYFYSSDCARVKGIPNYIKNRQRRKTKACLTNLDFINNISEADILREKLFLSQNTEQMLEVDLLKHQLIEESQRQKLVMSMLVDSADKHNHKRKQNLKVRHDDFNTKMSLNQNQAIQRRKKNCIVTRRNMIVQSVFDGEIIIDDRNIELLRKMGQKTVAKGYARLLPWKVLIDSFQKNTIKIWSMVNQPSRLLINKSDKLPPKNYLDIKDFEKETEVIMWIKSGELPREYDEDNVSFILKQTKDNFEICGICTKKFSPEETNKIDNNENRLSEIETESEAERDLLTLSHKDLNGESQLLLLKKEKFKLQELIEENLDGVGETSISKNNLYMWGALPEIYRLCKWRMIFLNSDFTYLYFTNLKYSIKYTDLLGAGAIAKKTNSTVMLRNQRIRENYDHKAFGIYFDPHYQDRLFIGPYFKEHSKEDIETLRYINQTLVCSESFNKMQGKIDYKCGHWLVERPYGGVNKNIEMEATIDLTADKDETVITERGVKRKFKTYENNIANKPKHSIDNEDNNIFTIMHNRDQIQVIDSTPKKPEDFNRYIITNIPHFGYLGAQQHDNSSEIDVSWPFENKLLRFPSVSSAIDFLQNRFSSLLQPVPETFKIKVLVMTCIDLENCHPVNAAILSGHYVCGEFGYKSVKTITNKYCQEFLGTTREELLKIFAKRAQNFVRKKVEELASVLDIKDQEPSSYNIVKILGTAKLELTTQEKLENYYKVIKNNLLLTKRQLADQVVKLISELPENLRNIENTKFRNILHRCHLHSINSDNGEPIEIPDSDEEQNESMLNTKVEESTEERNLLPVNTSIDEEDKSAQVMSSSPVKLSMLYEETQSTEVRSSLPGKVSIDEGIESTEVKGSFPVKLSPDEVIPGTGTSAYRPLRVKLKSILKPKLPIDQGTSLLNIKPAALLLKEENVKETVNTPAAKQQPQYLKGVKIVKTATGKFVLMPDKNRTTPLKNLSNSALGTKVVIKNNKIVSISKPCDTNKILQSEDVSQEKSTDVDKNISSTLSSNINDNTNDNNTNNCSKTSVLDNRKHLGENKDSISHTDSLTVAQELMQFDYSILNKSKGPSMKKKRRKIGTDHKGVTIVAQDTALKEYNISGNTNSEFKSNDSSDANYVCTFLDITSSNKDDYRASSIDHDICSTPDMDTFNKIDDNTLPDNISDKEAELIISTSTSKSANISQFKNDKDNSSNVSTNVCISQDGSPIESTDLSKSAHISDFKNKKVNSSNVHISKSANISDFNPEDNSSYVTTHVCTSQDGSTELTDNSSTSKSAIISDSKNEEDNSRNLTNVCINQDGPPSESTDSSKTANIYDLKNEEDNSSNVTTNVCLSSGGFPTESTDSSTSKSANISEFKNEADNGSNGTTNVCIRQNGITAESTDLSTSKPANLCDFKNEGDNSTSVITNVCINHDGFLTELTDSSESANLSDSKNEKDNVTTILCISPDGFPAETTHSSTSKPAQIFDFKIEEDNSNITIHVRTSQDCSPTESTDSSTSKPANISDFGNDEDNSSNIATHVYPSQDCSPKEN